MSFRLVNITPVDKSLLSRGIFIMIINAGKIPPHLGICVNNKVFMLNASGKVTGKPVLNYLKLFSKKNSEVLFVRLRNTGMSMEPGKVAGKSFEPYEDLSSGHTCLHPIRDFCSTHFGIDCDKAAYVFELLPILQKEGLLQQTYSMNLDGNAFTLPEYTMEEIKLRILELKKKEKQTV